MYAPVDGEVTEVNEAVAEDENLMPAAGTGNTFGFGVSKAPAGGAPALPKPGFSFGAAPAPTFGAPAGTTAFTFGAAN